MKKRAIVLLILGAALFAGSVLLAVLATANKSIVGGADWPTFLFVFFHEKKGLYALLALLGIASVVASLVVGAVKRK